MTSLQDRSTLELLYFTALPMNFFTPDRLEKIKALVHGDKPFIFDDGDIRTLHFDERVVQSAMRLSAPDELVIPYTQAMTGFLLFNPAPIHILVIGLGGGSLVKYCYRHLPSARMTVLESNADVIALRDKFMIPADDERLQVLHKDAALYLKEMAADSVDVILLDGFDANGASTELCSFTFLQDCQRVLHNQGALVMNMADDGDTITSMLTQGQILFGGRHIWWLKTKDGNSHIAVAVKTGEDNSNDALLREQAVSMCEKFALDLVYPKSIE
ncbi:fused MFS/spermidine synthase [Herminiimonas arsenitoxidans]|uniref:fused MFS/spermidine synthase n=1 Tax=Herminiimonas arsenitoxidans TaxID=1809410 RepID=UPI001E28332D|nr:fused MFS/spermidine synthase [Herminiimonas arsenitoxidans]